MRPCSAEHKTAPAGVPAVGCPALTLRVLQQEDGSWEISFPKSPAGFRDFQYLDEDVQVTLGNHGSPVVLMRRE